MFGKGSESGIARSQSIIQEGVTLRGEMKAEGDVRLDGTLEGSLVSKSRVIIGATGVLHADVDAGEVLVMGRVMGKIVGHRRVELRKGAHVEGDLTTQSLVIEEGVYYQGLSQMTVSPVGPIAAGPAADGRTRMTADGPRLVDKETYKSAVSNTPA